MNNVSDSYESLISDNPYAYFLDMLIEKLKSLELFVQVEHLNLECNRDKIYEFFAKNGWTKEAL